jgi:hypothetical protein
MIVSAVQSPNCIGESYIACTFIEFVTNSESTSSRRKKIVEMEIVEFSRQLIFHEHYLYISIPESVFNMPGITFLF